MTRLTEALERAHLVPAISPGPAPAAKTGDEVLRTWRFDAVEESHPPVPAPGAFPAPAAARAALQFPDDIANKMIVGPEADAGLVEQYRRVAALLHHAQTQKGVRSVMIGSAVASEGKTLTATNLALTLSHSFDRRVLLIDADFRRPSVHRMFGLPNDAGLVDILRSSTGGHPPVRAVSRNLWVLTAGKPTSDPMRNLVSDAMRDLLADAVEQMDWVVIDTPPVALMPDANLLARMIDTALLVISAGSTPYPLVQRAATAIGADRILGVILNRTDASTLAEQYGYYDYADRQPKPSGFFRRARKRR